MHTYPDAFALLRGKELTDGGSILDIPPTILDLLGVPVPKELEGRVLLAEGAKR
jgi:arylsulfatase A-like enzyme